MKRTPPRVRARCAAVVLSVVLGLVVAACTDSSSTTTGVPDTRDDTTTTSTAPTTSTATTTPGTTTTTSTPTTTTTTTSTTTTTPSTTTTTPAPTTTATTTAPPGSCTGGPGAALPASAIGVTRSGGDFDGDGARDELVVYGGQSPTPWRARVILDYGYAADIAIGDDVIGRALGGFDIDGGDDEGFVVVGAGAATTLVSVLALEGCDLTVVQMPGGFDAVFPVGATVGAQSGLECFPGDGIAVYSQTTPDGIGYDWERRRFGLAGNDLVLRETEERDLRSPQDDDVIFAVGTFDCGPLDL